MTFSSIIFLYFFLPLSLLCHNLVPVRWKNSVLLTASLIFFAWSKPVLLLILPLYILIVYLLGIILERQDIEAYRKVVAAAGMAFSLIPLLQELFCTEISLYLRAAAALITIHSITYLAEIYRRESRAQASFAALGVYLIMFPRALAGPVTHYNDLRPALARRSVDTERAADGILRFCIGLGKKVLLADRLYALWAQIDATSAPGAAAEWLGIGAFCLATWLGFSGYCDMAIGLGDLFGFDFPENFFYPLAALSIREFYRRWNATLFSWMRDHVTEPLCGKKPSRTAVVMILSTVLAAFFYGGHPTLLLWGLYAGLLLAGEYFLWGRFLEKMPRFVRRVITLLLILIGCIFFSAESFPDVIHGFAALVGLNGHGLGQAFYLVGSYWLVLLLAICSVNHWPRTLWMKLIDRFPALQQWFRPAAILVLLTCCTAYLI